MGTWGVALFSDDLASDVRDEFLDLLEVEGLSPSVATQRIVAVYATDIRDSELYSVFWLALAATQVDYGILQQEVLEKAADIIDSGMDLERWNEQPGLLRQRQRILKSLRAKLDINAKPKKKLKRRQKDKTDFEAGDAFAYQLKDGRFIVFRVLGVFADKGGSYPLVELCDWIGRPIPPRNEIGEMAFKTCRSSTDPLGRHSQFLLARRSEADFPEDRISVVAKGLANLRPPFSSFSSDKIVYWRDIGKLADWGMG